MTIGSRYLDGSYLTANPDWDKGDSAWKAVRVCSILSENDIAPRSVCEVGCGSGNVLFHLQSQLPHAHFSGFDISPQAAEFWKELSPLSPIQFHLGDFLQDSREHFDVLLMLDVFEHLRDPFTFLEQCRHHASSFVFHIPLDLSATSLLRNTPLLHARNKVGHIHYYTKDLALATLVECGYDIIDWRYTGAFLTSPDRSFKTKIASLPRRILCSINRDFGVRALGGETLLALARPLP